MTATIAGTAEQLRCAPDPAAVRARQDELMAFLSARSGLHRQRTPDGRTIPVFVETNRWLADCPECGAGIEADPKLELTCLGCGRVYRAELPADFIDVVTLLELRPDPGTRNFYPHKGETVADLARENELFGGIGVVPETTDEPHSHRILVPATAFDDGHDGDRYLEGSLAEELRTRFGDGYVIRHDDHGEEATGSAEVELIGKDTKEVADLKRAVAGEEVTP